MLQKQLPARTFRNINLIPFHSTFQLQKVYKTHTPSPKERSMRPAGTHTRLRAEFRTDSPKAYSSCFGTLTHFRPQDWNTSLEYLLLSLRSALTAPPVRFTSKPSPVYRHVHRPTRNSLLLRIASLNWVTVGFKLFVEARSIFSANSFAP